MKYIYGLNISAQQTHVIGVSDERLAFNPNNMILELNFVTEIYLESFLDKYRMRTTKKIIVK